MFGSFTVFNQFSAAKQARMSVTSKRPATEDSSVSQDTKRMKLAEDKDAAICSLPTEILQRILARLGPTDLRSAAMVSSRWMEVAKDPRTIAESWKNWKHNRTITINKSHKSIITGEVIRLRSEDKNKKFDLKYQYVYDIALIGGFVDYIPHQQGENLALSDLDLLGGTVKYKCLIPGCLHKDKMMGYREISCHVAENHGLLEFWMWKNLEKYPGLEEVFLMIDVDEIPQNWSFKNPIIITNSHKNIFSGKKTSLLYNYKTIQRELKYEYSLNITEIGGFIDNIPHEQGEGLGLADLDWMGKTIKYECPIPGCCRTAKKKKKMFGYKEFSIHIAKDHGLLEVWMRANLDKYSGLKEALHLIEG